ncbi:flagellar basal-body rod protein FlgG [Methylosinus sp. Ce-a6]|uniref:flagellar basal-body rod protein FlgG n=1 Tax=Methylosinus sp. Ce-a6 TaxID=2172005 RepID=UPI001357A4BD|nr:flagellar basal-body rod protein FlgG [Methylosinus sp. Ce-a6]
MRALAIAATGMNAQQQNIEVLSNNIANINTTAFKRSRAEFTDLLYQVDRLQGVSNRGRDAMIPEGSQTGLGVRLAAIRSLQTQGSLTQTGNQLDLALQGRGWFQIVGPDSETVYTRAGSFSTNAMGQLVTGDGYLVTPTIVIPNNATAITINQSGLVSATIGGQTAPQQLGQLTIANFANESGLEALGGNLFRQTLASGAPVVGVPGDPGFGTLSQFYLESSNVDPVKELVNLISAQRAFELSSKVIQAVDEMEGTVSKGIR